jgi:two-component system, chemotaxis family, chemotaxis protein CheY
MNVERSFWPAAPASATAGREAITALIIDDKPHVRAFLRLTLHSLGVTSAYEAGNGADGVALFEQIQPTVVLLDVNMPVMSGDQAIQQILALDPEAAVIVVTSDSQHETVKHFRDLGAMGYVLKHRPAEEVRAMLDEALGCFVFGDED